MHTDGAGAGSGEPPGSKNRAKKTLKPQAHCPRGLAGQPVNRNHLPRPVVTEPVSWSRSRCGRRRPWPRESRHFGAPSPQGGRARSTGGSAQTRPCALGLWPPSRTNAPKGETSGRSPSPSACRSASCVAGADGEREHGRYELPTRDPARAWLARHLRPRPRVLRRRAAGAGDAHEAAGPPGAGAVRPHLREASGGHAGVGACHTAGESPAALAWPDAAAAIARHRDLGRAPQGRARLPALWRPAVTTRGGGCWLTRRFRSTTTSRNKNCVLRWLDARTTTARTRCAAPKWRRCSTLSPSRRRGVDPPAYLRQATRALLWAPGTPTLPSDPLVWANAAPPGLQAFWQHTNREQHPHPHDGAQRVVMLVATTRPSSVPPPATRP